MNGPASGWRRLSENEQPSEGLEVVCLRLYWTGDKHGWLTALMQGEARWERPDLGVQGWSCLWSRTANGFVMMDDLSCAATNINEVATPLDFPRDLLPRDDQHDEAIYWRPVVFP